MTETFTLTRRQRAVFAVAEAIIAAEEAVKQAQEDLDELLEAINEESADDLPSVSSAVVRELRGAKGWGRQVMHVRAASQHSEFARRRAAADV